MGCIRRGVPAAFVAGALVTGALVTMAPVAAAPVAAAAGGTSQLSATTTTAPVATNLKSVVQLGDSIASGEGTLYGYTYTVTKQVWTGGVTNPTWSGPYKTCHDSPYAYGQVLSGFFTVAFSQFACSGASFANGITVPQTETGTVYRPAQFGNWTTRTDLNAEYDQANPDLVLVTLGADDLKFTKIVETCVLNALFHTPPTDCIPSNPGTAVQTNFFDQLPTLKANLATLANWIHARGVADGKVPKVVFSTYPDPLPAGGTTCPDTYTLKKTQLLYLSTLVHQLDQLEVQVVKGLNDPNVVAVTNAGAFAGHTWCTPNPWVYGLSVLTNAYAASRAPFHPTPTGQAVLASRAETAVSQLFPSSTVPSTPLQPAEPPGYVLASANGGAFAYGAVPFAGSLPGFGVSVNDVVGITSVPHGAGYRMVAADGGVFAFGDALFEGSLPSIGIHVNDVVGMAGTARGNGYWLVDKSGGVYTFGSASFEGSLPGLGVHVNDIVGITPTPDGNGYWLVGADGGVFAFGDAGFYGSLGARPPSGPVTGMAPAPNGGGYWLVGSDGGVFAFGDAPFEGSLPGLGVKVGDVAAISPSSGAGYRLVGADGGVFAFGDAPFYGSAVGSTSGSPVVGTTGP